MNSTKYATAVAAVKAMENTLLTANDFAQLVNTDGKNERESIISAKKGGADIMGTEDVWNFIKGYAPDAEELNVLLYTNDFHNLKAALKSAIADREPEKYYIRPTNLELSTLGKIVSSKNWELLPEYIRDTAQQAYELLTDTLDGQLADTFIDSAAMKAMQKEAERCKDDFIERYVEMTIACADIKTAYRCGKMKKSRDFLESAVCGSREIEKESLIDAVMGGQENFFSYLEGTSYSEGGELLAVSPAKYEKWCDDLIMELAETARMKSFGIQPLAAYYTAAQAEIKNLRILSVCKESGAAKETITERLRKPYV